MCEHVWTRMRKNSITKRISSKKVCANFRNTEKSLLFKNRLCYDTDEKRFSNIEKGEGDSMNTVFDIANWFLKKQSMTHKKLQKMCYYAQAWSYALKDRPIMSAEFEAWVHGPVCRELYEKYKGNYMYELTADSGISLHFSPGDEELLESVFETYGDFSGNALEVLTHGETPWINARAGCSSSEICSNKISVDDMKLYYKSIYIGDTVPDA